MFLTLPAGGVVIHGGLCLGINGMSNSSIIAGPPVARAQEIGQAAPTFLSVANGAVCHL